ncbi:MAG: hypothetical protein U0990_04950 [Candidatus Nanopelagicales bacterium]|nr:hypothetical protein [Candidatus Nanopelagicales bacterium]MDZ4249421.1 hypothetical protein [Candidatus Nanopelagicales bacterium]
MSGANRGTARVSRTSGIAAEVRLSDQAKALKDLLGPKLMAVTMGVRGGTVDKWIAGKVDPQFENEQRIRTAYQIFDLLKPMEASPTIRAWFMGMNPQMEDRSPAEAIAEGELREALAAARAFLAGG